MNYPKNIKYPESEYKNLIIVLSQIKKHLEINEIHSNQLHYIAYQQTSKRQPHNWIYKSKKTGNLVKKHSINNIENFDKIVNVNFELELYPNNCNDIHIETAIKRAIKEL